MKPLIIRVYRSVYQITRAKLFSFILAMLYITGLNLVTLYGLCILLKGLFPTGVLLRLFSFPYYFAPGFVMLAINLFTTPQFQYIKVEEKRKSGYTTVLIYTVTTLLLVLYIRLL